MTEQTSTRVAILAAKINPMSKSQLLAFVRTDEGFAAVKSAVASALTQAPSRKKFLGLF